VAATGLYGVLSYSIAEQRREIAGRAALGASRGRLIAMVLRQGVGFTLAALTRDEAIAAKSSVVSGEPKFHEL
jgi:ABC-type antimicrobial peptide transport system permease subunit